MNLSTRRLLFALFFISGFSGLVYQVVWTRIAFASFGIIMPVFSVVISVFMLGLSLGAWAGGRVIPYLQRTTGLSAAIFYAGAEVIIGLGSLAVPKCFLLGEHLLLTAGQTDSVGYLSLSAIALALSILPWCLFMGATFPLMMAYVRERDPGNAESFSFLYLANVLGAMTGTLLTAAVLVELFGFQRTLGIAALGNGLVALASGYLGWRQGKTGARVPVANGNAPMAQTTASPNPQRGMIKWILFFTGFSAMAMEVVWARSFTPTLKTMVYSFGSVIFCYLGATFLGSWLYRHDLKRGKVRTTAGLISFLAVAALLPILINDFRVLPRDWRGTLEPLSAMMLLASIGPLCGVLGYLTPKLIDTDAAGDPQETGKAYAINVLGCILGPLFACYILLPWISERYALILLSLPFFVFWYLHGTFLTNRQRWGWGTAIAAVLLCALFVSQDFEGRVSQVTKKLEVRRDHAASVFSVGEGRERLLMVNGLDMTVLTPVTKYMVHLPLAFLKEKPKSALIICFGMGTTYRSALGWDIETTAVELVPSVRDAFGFYHADAAEYARHPKGHIVIDDGRRYLKRSTDQFDVIVIDPPPPVMAAGSSLLYSIEFYELAKKHLKPGGIFQAWVPENNIAVGPAVLRSVTDSFPHIRCFRSIEDSGWHILASMQPIEMQTVAEFMARLPLKAKQDLLEWSSSQDLAVDFQHVLSNELPIPSLLNTNAQIRITDDRPYNEYFLVRDYIRR
jgi:spermidine synthase